MVPIRLSLPADVISYHPTEICHFAEDPAKFLILFVPSTVKTRKSGTVVNSFLTPRKGKVIAGTKVKALLLLLLLNVHLFYASYLVSNKKKTTLSEATTSVFFSPHN